MFLIMLIPAVMVVFALVWEAGQMLATKAELLAAAHSAARAATHQLDEAATLDQGAPALDTEAARRAAIDYLNSTGLGGHVLVERDRVVVLARTTYAPVLLPITETPIEAEATATALQPPAGCLLCAEPVPP